MSWKVKTEDKSFSVNLLVGAGSSVVIVFVIGSEIEVSAEWQGTAYIETCVTPLGIPAGVDEFDAGIRPGMVVANCKTGSTVNRLR
jgi:hypothetical protein